MGSSPFFAIGLYFFVSFLAFFPCLALGRIYFDGDILVLYSNYWSLIKEALGQGILPLWNPYVFAGQPFFADPNTLSAYAPLYPFLGFPLGPGISLFYFFHLLVALCGMHYWLKTLRLSPGSRIVGALLFGFSGMFWFEIIHIPVFAAFAWFPWFLGAMESYSTKPSGRCAFASGFFLALLFLAGSPQVFLGASLVGTALFLFRIFTAKPSLPSFGGRLLHFSAFFAWGILPMLLLALPFVDFARFSDRFLLAPDYESYTGFSIPPSEWYRFFFPLRPVDQVQNVLLPENLSFTTEAFLCPLVLFLVLAALVYPREKGSKGWLLLFSFFFVMISFGRYFPLHHWLFLNCPGFSLLRGPFRFIFIYQTFFCALAAMGFEAVRQIKPGSFPAKRACIGTGLFLAVLWAGALLWGWKEWVLLAWISLTGAGMGLYWLVPRFRKPAVWIAGFSFIVSLLGGGWSFCSSRLGPPANLDFQKEAALFSAIREKIGPNRFFLGDRIPFPVRSNEKIFQLDCPANISIDLQMKNAGGSNALSLLARGELYQTPFPTFLRLMDIQGFATGNEKGEVPGFKRYQWGNVKFYDSTEQKKCIYAPARWEVLPDARKRLEAMEAPRFNPYQTSFLSEQPPGASLLGFPAEERLTDYEMVRDGLDRQEWKVQMKASGLLVFPDANFPGWKATVDDSPLEIYTANHLFRGVFVPSGSHRVVFEFKPASFSFALFLFLTWVASAAALSLRCFSPDKSEIFSVKP